MICDTKVALLSLKSYTPQELVCVFLPAVHHVLADGLQLLVDFVRLYHVGSQSVSKSVAHCTKYAILQQKYLYFKMLSLYQEWAINHTRTFQTVSIGIGIDTDIIVH
jgi:hypothetical protein